jgi:Cdc6-like AAA superfamily ATPase
MQLAQAAGLHQDPTFQQRLVTILQLRDIDLAKQAIDQLRPIVLEKLLLGPQIFEPPDPDAIDGLFPIGLADNQAVFGLNPHELSMHTFITGSSGTGKSVIVQNLLEGLRRYNRDNQEPIHYWIFDFMAEYRHVLRLLEPEDNLLILRPKDFRFNPLQPPPGVDPVNWLQIFCDTLASTTGIFFGAKDIIVQFIDELYMLAAA